MKLLALLPSLVLLASPAHGGGEVERLFEIAMGEGGAGSWTRRRALEALEDGGPRLVELFVGLDSLQAEHDTSAGRWDPRELVLDAAAGLDREDRRVAVRRAMARDDSLERRLAAWSFVSEVTGEADLELYIELASGVDPELIGSGRLQRTYSRQLGAMLRAGDGRSLVAAVAGMPEVLERATVHAVTDHMGRWAVDVLTGLHGVRDSLAIAVLESVSRVGPVALAYGRDDLVVLLREESLSLDPERRNLAFIGLGELRHYESLPVFVDALDREEDELLRSKARWAATRIVARDLGEDSHAWDQWVRRERRWVEDEMSDLIGRLNASSSPQAVMVALRQAEQHSIHRDRFVEHIVPLLESQDLALAVGAARTLQALDSPEALPELVEAMAHGPQPVRDAAHDALRRIAGRDLGDASAWFQWVRS